MDNHLLNIFLEELDMQISFSMKAVSNIDRHLVDINESDDIELWYSVQSLLVSTANISKLLWPSKNESDLERRRVLRDFLGVYSDALLSSDTFKKRTMRNVFEHFDKELEKWYSESESKNFANLFIGPEGSIDVGDKRDIHRALYTDKLILYYRGERLELVPLVKSIQSLQTVVKTAIQKLRKSKFD